MSAREWLHVRVLMMSCTARLGAARSIPAPPLRSRASQWIQSHCCLVHTSRPSFTTTATCITPCTCPPPCAVTAACRSLTRRTTPLLSCSRTGRRGSCSGRGTRQVRVRCPWGDEMRSCPAMLSDYPCVTNSTCSTHSWRLAAVASSVSPLPLSCTRCCPVVLC